MTEERIHSIKLKGPWTIVRRPGDAVSMNPRERETVHLPADWHALFGPISGTAVLERRFNRPTGLTDRHRVRVEFAQVSGLKVVELNGAQLKFDRADGNVQAVDITSRIEPHNRLTVEVCFDPARDADDPGGLWQPVVLQIEEHEDQRK